MKRLLPALMFALLVACNQAPTSNNPAITNPGAQNTAVSDPTSFWKPPASANKKDGAFIIEWFKANDGCVGGEDPKVYEPICKIRDGIQDRLRKRGWCWGAPMDKTAADDDWHHCGTYNTDSMSNADADVHRGMAYLHKDDHAPPLMPADHPSISPIDSHDGDWYNEHHRPKSPLLQAYENAVESIDQKTALANVLKTCGIRGEEWHQQILSSLNQLRHSPSNEEMWQRLTPADAASAQHFDQIVIDGETEFNLGGQSKAAACRSISNMPWATNNAPFE